MKRCVVIFVGMIVVSCLFNSFLLWVTRQTYPPYPIKTGIAECVAGNSGTTRQDFSIPEIQYTDGARNFFYAKEVRDARPEDNIEMPMGSTF